MDQTNRDYFENYEMHRFFYDVYSNARTGVLKIYFPDSVVKTVYFSEGNIVYASSNGEKDKLVTILIKYKKLTQEQLDAALRQMDKNISLGRNLVNMGFITHKELIWAVKVQVISIIHSIIVLKQGDYLFNESPLPSGVINLPLNTMKVIFDSIIMFQDREWIAEKIQQPETIYKKTLLFEEGKNRLITNPDLLEVAEGIDGKRTLAELTGMTTLEDFKVFKLLYALKFLSLIEEKIPDTAFPASADIFEIQDEPEEDLELAEEAFEQLGDTPEVQGPKEEPTERLEMDQLPFSQNDDASIEGEEPTEKIDISNPFEPEVQFSEPEIPSGLKESGEDVFVEFKLNEDELSYEEESVEEELQSGNVLAFEPDKNDLEDEMERTELQEAKDGFALTEQDIDSVIMDRDEESPETQGETKRVERTELPMEENSGSADDATLVEGNLPQSESFDEEVIDASTESSGKWLLVSLIIISIILFAGTMYYYQFWLPQQNQTSILPEEKIQIAKAAPKKDVTTTSITSLEKVISTTPAEQEPTLAGNKTASETIAKNPLGIDSKTDTSPLPTSKNTSVKAVGQKVQVPSNTDRKEKTKKEITSSEAASNGKTNHDKSAVSHQLPSKGNKVKAKSYPLKNKSEAIVAPGTTKKDSSELSNKAASEAGNAETVSPEDLILPKYTSVIERSREVFNNAGPKAVTLQLEVACKGETIKQALHLLKDSEKIYLVPFHYGGSDCVIVCFGLFNTNQEAMSVLNNLPQIFYEDNNEPFVASANRLKRRFQ